MSRELAVILNDIRSCENVGSILRTAEFFGVKKVYFVGVTPYPTLENDNRLPHIREKLDLKIKKVSLGAEDNLEMEHYKGLTELISVLKKDSWHIVALEQDPASIELSDYETKVDKLTLVLGTERTGLTKDELELVEDIIEIPRAGQKESLNVSVAFGLAISKLSSL